MKRRVFLRSITALAATGIPLVARGEASRAAAYGPGAPFALDVADVPLRRNAAGRQLLARVYQPKASDKRRAAFPVLLDLHGGAWVRGNRLYNESMDRAIAASGVVVVAIDMTLAGEAPYPASVQDASYAVRWVKARAQDWNADPATLGLLGSSSGGYVAELLALRPDDERYNAVPFEGEGLDSSVAYVAALAPISDPYSWSRHARNSKRADLVEAAQAYFRPWQTIHEANPQEMLDGYEAVELRPMLVLQGALDDDVAPRLQEKFVATYNSAGGECRLEIFKGCAHDWLATPGPDTDRAYEMVKGYIARQVSAD